MTHPPPLPPQYAIPPLACSAAVAIAWCLSGWRCFTWSSRGARLRCGWALDSGAFWFRIWIPRFMQELVRPGFHAIRKGAVTAVPDWPHTLMWPCAKPLSHGVCAPGFVIAFPLTLPFLILLCCAGLALLW